jgi:chromosome segregation ATPase
MGFGVQIRALQQAQREQAERIASLEQEIAELKASKNKMSEVLTRIEALEQHNAVLAARRREAVGQFNNLRTLHQEADNAFQMRTVDAQPDDFEGVLSAYSTMITTAMNHHQRALGQLRASGQMPSYNTPLPQFRQPVMPASYQYAYPPAYSQADYCYAHNMPYCCRICSK